MRALSIAVLLFGLMHRAAAGEGSVGITVDRDFTVVSAVIPDGPAAQAGIRAGDRLIAVDGYPTEKMQNLQEFANRVSGGVGAEVDLEVRRSEPSQTFHVRLRRTPPPSQIPPDFDAHQVRNGIRKPTRRCSEVGKHSREMHWAQRVLPSGSVQAVIASVAST